MRKFAKIAAPALAAIAALGAIVPTAAQAYPAQQQRHYDGRGEARAIRGQIDQLQRMVERRDGRDRISEREAAGLRRDVQNLRSTFNAWNRNGLSRSEVRTLQDRIGRIRDRIGQETHDRDHRRH